MPYLVQPTDVEAIIDFDPIISDITPFIAAADELVQEICVPVNYPSPTRLFEIERWLAAHFLAIRDPRYQSETMGRASGSYVTGQPGMNLSATPYGQQVLLLDTAGGLARLDAHISRGKRATVGITHLGSCKAQMSDDAWRFYALLDTQ